MIKGIDLSENNEYINWTSLAHNGFEFVMVRCSWGKGHEDSKFREYVNKAHLHGLKVGAYHYSYALNPEAAKEEAKLCADIIAKAGCLLELPVFFDMEDADHYKANHYFDFSSRNITEICRSFCENLGLNYGVYASESWLNTYIDWRSLGCPVWNASWLTPGYHDLSRPEQYRNWDAIGGMMWQYTDSFMMDGFYYDADLIW